ASFLRKIGIEINFAREGRTRTRTIHIAIEPNRGAQENANTRLSAPSASSAPESKSSPINGFADPPLQTVAHDAGGNRVGEIVRPSPLKLNGETAADDADANLRPQSAPQKAAVGGWRGRL